MLLISSPRFADHLTPPGHPESPERAEVLDGVAERARLRGVEVVEPRRGARRRAVADTHARRISTAISATSGKASMLDPDTFTSPETATLARLAAGAAILAVDHCLASAHAPGGGDRPQSARNRCQGRWRWSGRRAITPSRPRDGVLLLQQHRDRGCACPRARRRRASRSSTTTCITATARSGASTTIRPCCSSRRISIRSIPGTGAATEIGSGAGAGFTVNVPLEAARPTPTTSACSSAIVVPVLRRVPAGAGAGLGRLRRARTRSARADARHDARVRRG